MNLIFEWATFSSLYFLRNASFLYVLARATFPEDTILHCQPFFHSYPYLSFNNQLTSTGFFTLKLHSRAQSGCTNQIFFVLNTRKKRFSIKFAFSGHNWTRTSIGKCKKFQFLRCLIIKYKFQYWFSVLNQLNYKTNNLLLAIPHSILFS